MTKLSPIFLSKVILLPFRPTVSVFGVETIRLRLLGFIIVIGCIYKATKYLDTLINPTTLVLLNPNDRH